MFTRFATASRSSALPSALVGLAILGLSTGCGRTSDDAADADGAPILVNGMEVRTINETYITEADPAANVDSPAFWLDSRESGLGGRDGDVKDDGAGARGVLLTTAKEGDQVLVHDAADGRFLQAVGGSGAGPGRLERPNGILVVGDAMLVVERDNRRVQAFDLRTMTPIGSFGESELLMPYGLSAYRLEDGAYRVYVTDNHEGEEGVMPPADALAHRVRTYRVTLSDADSAPSTASGGVEASAAVAMTADYTGSFGDTSADGALWVVESIVADPAHNRLLIADEDPARNDIKIYDLEGRFTGELMGKGLFTMQPEGIALAECGVDGSGDGGDGGGGGSGVGGGVGGGGGGAEAVRSGGPAGAKGFWVTTDQGEFRNHFLLFDRITLEHIGTFQGSVTLNTDGIALTTRAFGPFTRGALFAVDDDQATAAFDWAQVVEMFGLDERCGISE